jgi:micrococcal nuclease
VTQIWHNVAALFLASTLTTPAHAWEPTVHDTPTLATWQGHAIGVLDGDSITVDGIEWRLLGFDAPEIDRAKCEGERRLAIIARARLGSLIAAHADTLELTDSGERDRHKRPLARLILGGTDAGRTLIAEGLARPYRGGMKKGWCSRDSRDDLVSDPPLPSRAMPRPPSASQQPRATQ